MKNKVKIIGLVIIFVGLMVGLANLIGWFSHPDREELVESIRHRGVALSDMKAFDDLMKEFPPLRNWKKSDIKGIRTSSSVSSGGLVIPIGPIQYFTHSNQEKKCAGFDQIIEWSKESSYPWVSWVITAFGFILTLIGYGIERRSKPSQTERKPRKLDI
jgi:hypothetical protein